MAHGPIELSKGWRWVRLGEVADYQPHSIDPRRFPCELHLLYSIPSYDKGKTPERWYGKQAGSNELLIEGNRQRLKPDVVLNALIPLPPLPEQRCIVAYLDRSQARVTALKKAQEPTEIELQRRDQAILNKAFWGRCKHEEAPFRTKTRRRSSH